MNLKFKISNLKSQSGMTLVEVIISMFVLTVLVVLYASALNTLAATRRLRNESKAYHAANKQMETLRETPYASLPPSGTISDVLVSSLPSGAGSYTVSSYPSYAGMKEIIVTVTWNDGIARSVVLRTLSGSGGINP